MKNVKCLLGIIAIGLCLLSINTYVLAQDSSQPPWRTSVWPALSSAQYYWYEPQTDLTAEQVDAIFKELTANEIYLMMSRWPNQVCTIDSAQSMIGRLDEEKKAKNGKIKLGTIWKGYAKPYPVFIALNTIQRIDLYYDSKANNKWRLSISAIGDLYDIFFKDEDSARKFGSAVASILKQGGFSLKLPKLGLICEDLTPAQAEALGKTRIDNVLVTLVAIDGPADKANIQPLDVIAEVNGVKVKNDSHFVSLIGGIASGTKISLTCLRRTEIGDKGQKQFDWKPVVIEITVK